MKNQVEEFKLKEKVKEVKINEKQHFLLFISALMLVNMLLFASTIFVLVFLTKWYNWILCSLVWVVCFWFSFKVYRDRKIFHKCTLYKNAIAINSIWFNVVFEISHIYDVKVKESVLDRLFKINTLSMEIYLLNENRRKFTIHFIEEDANELKNEILSLIANSTSEEVKINK